MLIDGKTLHEHAGYRFALFERRGGHAPELDNLDDLFQMGRFIARIHLVGSQHRFATRPELNIADWVEGNVAFLLREFVPKELRPAYESLMKDIVPLLQQGFAKLPKGNFLRLHGDCHPGNVLYRDETPHFVDFDDCINGPAMQDIWMLLSGDYTQRCLQLAEIAEGYNEFYDFPMQEIGAIETLRTMRLINYAAWLGKRWGDPAFPMHFPWFDSPRYWSDHILELREQFFALQSEPLKLY